MRLTDSFLCGTFQLSECVADLHQLPHPKELMMIRTLSLLVLLFVFPILAAAETPAAEFSTTVAWRMSLGADGKITALEPRSDKSAALRSKTIAALREKLEPVVRSWEFEPGTINGQPASTETILSVDVSLLPKGDETLAIRVDDVRTGGDIENQTVPSAPYSMLAKLKENGGVVQRIYEISYDQLGAITKVSVLEGSTKVNGQFPDHTEKSFRRWKFVPERVAGIGVPGKVVIGLCFFTHGSQRKDREEKCAWKYPGSKAALGQGQSLAIESSVHLKSDVVGSIL